MPYISHIPALSYRRGSVLSSGTEPRDWEEDSRVFVCVCVWGGGDFRPLDTLQYGAKPIPLARLFQGLRTYGNRVSEPGRINSSSSF
jgi:hypothetical protein